MKTETISTTTEIYSLEDLKNVLAGERGKNIKITPQYKTEVIPGFDPHDVDYIEVFTGIKLTFENN
jgi:hypothetical protein